MMLNGPGEKRRRAEVLLMEAEQLESAGDLNGAVEKYRLAYKLCPELQKPSEDDGGPDDDGGVQESNPYRVSGYRRMPPANSGFRTFPATQLDDPAGAAEMLDFFDQEGYLTVDGVLNEAEVGQALEYFKAFMAGIDIDVENQESLEKCMLGSYNGIVGDYGAGHSAMNWYCRSRPYVSKLFHTAYRVPADQKMITSFTGFNVIRNPDVDPAWAMPQNSWFHFDAGSWHNGRYIQGVLNLLDTSGLHDPGLVLLPRSHTTLFAHIAKVDEPNPVLLTEMNRQRWKTFNELELKEVPFRIPMKPGTLTIWKSTVFHCNCPGSRTDHPSDRPEVNEAGFSSLPEPATPETETDGPSRDMPRAGPLPLLRRVAVYICFLPDPQDNDLTSARLELFARGQTTCHQPDLIRMGGSLPLPTLLASGSVLNDIERLPEGAKDLL